MEIKVLGISGSSIKDGNVETFLSKILESVSSKPGVSTEMASFAKLDIRDCQHCNYCIKHQTKEKYCSIKDDAQPLLEKVESSDILVLATPVYFMRTSGRMAAFIDRLRMFMFGNLTKGRLKNKIGISAAVSWLRHGGVETSHLSHIMAFLALEMIPVSAHNSVSFLGASAVSSENGSGEFDPGIRIGIEKDKIGLQSIRAIMNRALELTAIIKNKEGIDRKK
jgi:multimeric flavodoxin WrbA